MHLCITLWCQKWDFTDTVDYVLNHFIEMILLEFLCYICHSVID